MSYQNVKSFRQRLKERAVYVLGDKCQCCGYNQCITALEFHHLDPNEKETNFGDNANRSWATTNAEIQKCILVCANCHREIHAGLIDNNELQSSYNSERAAEITQKVEDLKTHKLYYCNTCGIEVSQREHYCPTCAAILRRKVERPQREELKKLIRSLPFTQIAANFGVTDNAIRKWCKSMNLPHTKTTINQYSDKDWEQL